MSAQQYRDALDKIGMSQISAGKLFQVGSRTARRWALDEARVPVAVAMVLRLMVKKRLRFSVPIMNEETRQLDSERLWILTATSHVVE